MLNLLRVTVLVLLTIGLFVGCSKSPEKMIIGEWQENGESESVEFLKDGTIAVRDGDQTVVGEYRFQDDGNILVAFGGEGAAIGPIVIGFEFDGDVLKLTAPDGEVADYMRITGRPKSDNPTLQIGEQHVIYATQQISEGLNLSGGAKAAVAEYFMDRGEFPATNAEAGLSPAGAIQGKFTLSVSVQNGEITIRYRDGGEEMHNRVAGKTLVLTPEPDSGYLNWSCGSPDIDAEILPSACR